MSHLFDPESPLMSALSAVFDAIVLSLTALVCALPAVTAGASAAALYCTVGERASGLGSGPRRFFFHFRRLFRLSTLSWTAAAAALLLMVLNVRIAASMAAGPRLLFWSGAFFLAACVLLSCVFLPPLAAAEPRQPLLRLWKRSFFWGVAKLPRSLLVLVLQAVPAGVFFWSPMIFLSLAFLWTFFWPFLSVWFWFRLTAPVLPEPSGS